MPIISVTLPADGENADASDVDNPINAILAVVNGNLDQDNFANGGIPTGKLADSSVTAAKLNADAKTGWFNVGTTPTTIAIVDNQTAEVTFNAVNLSSILAPGMRLSMPRSVAAPTKCVDLESSSSQYASVAGPTGFTFTDDYTVTAWIKPESYTGAIQTVFSRNSVAGTNGLYFALNSTGQVTLTADLTAGNNKSIRTYQSVPKGVWTHIAASMDMSGAIFAMYINGNVVPFVNDSAGTATSFTNTGTIYVGRDTSGLYFDGEIAEVSVWNSIRTQAQIRANMGQSIASPGTEGNLVGYWKMNNNFTDSSTNANNLTGQNGAVATAADNPMHATEYAIIHKVAFSTNTTVTVHTGNRYIAPTDGATGVQYSTQRSPYGWPAARSYWMVRAEWHNTASLLMTTSGTISGGTWQAISGSDVQLPIGDWSLDWNCEFTEQCSGAVSHALRAQYDTAAPTFENADRFHTANEYPGSIYLVTKGFGHREDVAVDAGVTMKLWTTSESVSPIAIYMQQPPVYATFVDNYA